MVKRYIVEVITFEYRKKREYIVTRISFREDNIIKKVKKIKFGVMACNSSTQKVSLSKILTA